MTYVRSFSGDGRLVNLGWSYMPMVVGDQVVIVHTGRVSDGRVIAAPQDLPRRPGDWSGPGDVVPDWSVLGFGQHRLASGRTDWIVIWGGVAAGPVDTFYLPEPLGADQGSSAGLMGYVLRGPKTVFAAAGLVQSQRPVWPAVEGGAGDILRISLPHLGPPGTDVGAPERSYIQVSRAVATAGAPETPAVSADRRTGLVWTVLASTAQPGPPVWTGPRGVTPAESWTAAWEPVEGQTHVQVARAITGGSTEYLTAAGAWTSAVSWIATTAASRGVGAWPTGLYTVQVRVRVDGVDSEPVSVQVLSMAAPLAPVSVSVSSTSVRRPTVTITPAVADAGLVSGYEITITAAGEVLKASTVSAAGVWVPRVRWPDGDVTVTARSVLSGLIAGPATSVTVTISVPPIPAPVVESITVPHPTSGLPGARLIVDLAGPYDIEVLPCDHTLLGTVAVTPGYVPDPEAVRIVPWPGMSSATITDYTPAAGYAIRLVDGEEHSPWVTVVSAVGPEDQAQWLLDPTRPELAVMLRAYADDEVRHDLRAETIRYLDDDHEQVAYAGPVLAPSGTSTVWALNQDELDKALTLLKARRPLVYRWPASSDGTPGRVDRFLPVAVETPRLLPDVNHDHWRVTYRWAAYNTTNTQGDASWLEA